MEEGRLSAFVCTEEEEKEEEEEENGRNTLLYAFVRREKERERRKDVQGVPVILCNHHGLFVLCLF